MTTMPPEMSSNTGVSVTLPHSTSISRDSLSSLQSPRSRFMITDILAGSAAAAAAAMQNGLNMSGRRSPSPINLQQHPQHLQQHLTQQQQQQHQAALQHYLAQQQQILQQQNRQMQTSSSSSPPATPPPLAIPLPTLTSNPMIPSASTSPTSTGAQNLQTLAPSQNHHHHQQQHQQQRLLSFPVNSNPVVASTSSNTLSNSSLLTSSPTTSIHYTPSGSSSASTVASLNAIREERERERERLLDFHNTSSITPSNSLALASGFSNNDIRKLGLHHFDQHHHSPHDLHHMPHHHSPHSQPNPHPNPHSHHHHHQQQLQHQHLSHHHNHNLHHDDRSRSPQPVNISVRDLTNSATSHLNTTGGSGSISGDQASTIDDSDSDCGAKDDDGNSIKSDNLMGLTKKQRKARTAFTDHQLQTLEKSFERQKYLSVQDRMELANKLELSDCQVKTWYQNRRTKWKRQTAVGLELLAEAGNYAAFQRLYGASPYMNAWPYAHQNPHGAAPTAIDLYYRQAAAAAVLQKPLSYRMYPGMPPMAGMPGMPVAAHPPPPPPHLTHLSASTSLSSLSSYYQNGLPLISNGGALSHLSPAIHSPAQSSDISDKQQPVADLTRTPSPHLNPGSPPEKVENNNSCSPPSDEERDKDNDGDDDDDEDDAIEV